MAFFVQKFRGEIFFGQNPFSAILRRRVKTKRTTKLEEGLIVVGQLKKNFFAASLRSLARFYCDLPYKNGHFSWTFCSVNLVCPWVEVTHFLTFLLILKLWKYTTSSFILETTKKANLWRMYSNIWLILSHLIFSEFFHQIIHFRHDEKKPKKIRKEVYNIYN